MANEEADAASIIGVCSYAGGTLAVVKAYSIAEVVEFLTVRAQAAVGPTQRNVHRRDLHASLRMVGGIPGAAADSTGSLVLTFYKMDKTTLKTITITTMKAGSRGFDMNDEAAPGEWSAEYMHMGSMAASPIAVT